MRGALLGAALGGLAALPAQGESVTLRWRYPAYEHVAGFRVHVGPAPGRYERSIDVGRPTPDADGVFEVRIELEDVAGSHLAISAYDETGRESPPSNEWARAAAPPALGVPGRPRVVAP
jgi:hypothetical protein